MLYMARLTLKSQGFTIVELIVVIVVLGILTAIVTISYQGIQRNTREATLQGDLRKTAQEIEAYKSQNSRYPRYLGAINNLQGAAPAATTTLGYAFISNSTAGAYCLHARSTIDTTQVYRIESGSSTIRTGQCTQTLVTSATPSAPELLNTGFEKDGIAGMYLDAEEVVFGWSDPKENGGASITSYRVRVSFGGGCASIPDYNFTFNALSNGQNAVGTGVYYIYRDAAGYSGALTFAFGGCVISSPNDISSISVSAANSLGYGDERVFTVRNVNAM